MGNALVSWTQGMGLLREAESNIKIPSILRIVPSKGVGRESRISIQIQSLFIVVIRLIVLSFLVMENSQKHIRLGCSWILLDDFLGLHDSLVKFLLRHVGASNKVSGGKK